MGKQIFLSILILCVSLSQGFANLSNNGSADSLEHLVRKKRVLDARPYAMTQVRFRDFSYVVNIKRDDNYICAASILSSRVILTAATCVLDNTRYFVVAGTISTVAGGTLHTVNGILIHPEHHILALRSNIALLDVEPPITFGRHRSHPIPIYNLNNGQLPPNTLVTVSGFGKIFCSPGVLEASNELQAIQIPTSTIQSCRDHHRSLNQDMPDNEIICTHHPQKSCSPSEFGNPLVYQDQLVGVLVWDGYNRGSDVFVNVAFGPIRHWIMTNMFPARIPRFHVAQHSPPTHHS